MFVCCGGGHLRRQTGIFFVSRKGLSVVCVCVLIFLLGVRSGKFSTISLPSIAAFTIAVTISFIFRETLDASSILCGNPACGGCIGVEPGGEIINEAPSRSFILSYIQDYHFCPGSCAGPERPPRLHRKKRVLSETAIPVR